MKKKLWILFVLLLAVSVLGITAAADDNGGLPTVCEHCKVPVEWTPLSAAEVRDTAKLTTGHYYVAMEEDSYDSVVKTIADGQTVCLYLNGKTMCGTTRGLNIQSGGTLNIMGEGTITGRGTTAGVVGACCNIEAGGTLNQYGGTLTYVVYKQRHGTNGGVLYVAGTYNLYGGIVENGIARKDDDTTGSGGNIYVAAGGEFNMYGGAVRNGTAGLVGGNIYAHGTSTFRFLGGSITGGTAGTAGNCVYNRGSLTLGGKAEADDFYLNSQTDKGGPALADMVCVQEDFTGNVVISMNDPAFGVDVGRVEEGGFAGTVRVLNSILRAKASAGELILTAEGYCDHCDTTAAWTPLDADATSLQAGHYFLEQDTLGTAKNIYVGNSVCLHLNGKTLEGTTRAFVIYPGGKLNIMGDGTVLGHGSTGKYPHGGVINIMEGGEMNLYSGTLTYAASDDTALSACNGGVLNVEGTVNMFGGTVNGGVATNAGGNVFVGIHGVLNITGGTIDIGKMGSASSDSGIYNRGTVILSGDPVVMDLLQKPNTADGGPALGDMLILDGDFCGTLSYRVSGAAAGLDIGNRRGGSFVGATIKVNKATTLIPSAVGSDLILTNTKSIQLFASDGTVAGYDTLQGAVDAYTDGSACIVLLADSAEDALVNSDIVLDLNGYDITGSLSGTGTVYCKDSHTDDYTVADGIYGQLPAGDNVSADDGYLQITQDGQVSFHKLNMRITSMCLRQSVAGLYFNASFAGDELVSATVESFGVVLNAVEPPDAGNMETTSLYSAFTSAQWVHGVDRPTTGTMLSSVMKTDNSTETNTDHANYMVYGNVYIKTANGYIYGDVKSFTLRQIVEQVDAVWQELNGEQIDRTVKMYETYAPTMDSWTIPNLKLAKQASDAYAAVEKTATDADIASLDGLYAGTNAYHGELHDHADTGGTSDGKQPLEVWKTYMEALNMDFATIVDHKQVLHMRLDEWDGAIFIGGSEAATTITDREGVKLHYNMTFARPEGLEAVLNAFPEFDFREWTESDRAGCGGQMHFNYPSFTAERFTQLCESVYANGGFLSIVHPKSDGYVTTDVHTDAWFMDNTGVEVFYTYNTDRDGWQTQANYELWTGLLAAGKKVFATTGNDEHDMPSDKALSTFYTQGKDADYYVQNLRVGNFTAGPVGIRMSVGDAVMGSTAAFAGQRLVFSIGDFHESVYDPTHTYRVDLISDEGIVFSQQISCEGTAYFAIDAQDVSFYRVEVFDTTLNSRIAIGNPIWNTK